MQMHSHEQSGFTMIELMVTVGMIAVLLIGFTIVTLAHTAPFPFLLDVAGPTRSVWHMSDRDSVNPLVYLTFDDGPNPTATPELLDVLAREDVRATFFLIDRYITDDTAFAVARWFSSNCRVPNGCG